MAIIPSMSYEVDSQYASGSQIKKDIPKYNQGIVGSTTNQTMKDVLSEASQGVALTPSSRKDHMKEASSKPSPGSIMIDRGDGNGLQPYENFKPNPRIASHREIPNVEFPDNGLPPEFGN